MASHSPEITSRASNNPEEGFPVEAVRILVVDDEKDYQDILQEVLSREGYRVTTASTGEEALELVYKDGFDIVITDFQMPRTNGVELLKRIKEHDSEIAVILISGYATLEAITEALQNGAHNFIMKPFDMDEILTIVRKVVRSLELTWRNKDILYRLEPRLELTIPSTTESASGAIFIIMKLISSLYFPKDTLLSLPLVLEEALLNAVIHGNKRDPKKNVYINCNVTSQNLEIVIRDEGEGFNPKEVADPTKSDNILKGTGRGIFIMRSYMDEVSYNEKGNELRMVKRRGAGR
ncbi:MAG: response regulator [bacterium]